MLILTHEINMLTNKQNINKMLSCNIHTNMLII